MENKRIVKRINRMIDTSIYFFEINRVQKSILSICVCLCFVSILILNSLFPLFTDDWAYTFIFRSDPPIHITNVKDIMDSQYNHYFTWGGRFVVHFIAQFLLMLKPWLHDLINALAFTYFIYLIYKISNCNRKLNPVLFIIIYFLIYSFQPAFMSTVLWITGSANYLWGTLIILIFIYPYYLFFRNSEYKLEGFSIYVYFFVGGIIAGWTNENMSVAVILMLLFLCLYFKRRGVLPKWCIVGVVGFSIGCVLLLAAPGNYVRMEVANEIIQTPSLIETLRSRVYTMVYHYFYYGLPLIPIYIIGLVALLKDKNISYINRKQIIFASFIFIITAHIAYAIMIASPYFPERALFGILTFAVIAISILYANIQIKNVYLKVLKYFGIILLISISSYNYYHDYNMLSYAYDQWEERGKYIKQQKRKGNLNIELEEKIIIADSRYHLHELSTDSSMWCNRAFSKYMGVNSIRISE